MRLVADAMRSPPVTVGPATTVQQASATMLDAQVQAAVVVADGRVSGMVTAERLSEALAQGYDPTDTLVSVVAEREPPLVNADEPLAEAHQRMRAADRTIAVVTAGGRPVGMLEDRG
jgi:predicted transcriptional regulator